MSTNRQIAIAIGLKPDAVPREILATVARMLGEPEPSEHTLTEGDDPRDAMTQHALAEVEKARAAGVEISFTEGLKRARARFPKLDKELSEGYASNRWTR
jgi:hypothetical protein